MPGVVKLIQLTLSTLEDLGFGGQEGDYWSLSQMWLKVENDFLENFV